MKGIFISYLNDLYMNKLCEEFFFDLSRMGNNKKKSRKNLTNRLIMKINF